MVKATRASARRMASPPTPTQSLAKHDRKPLQLGENKRQRPESIASFCRFLASAPHLTRHSPLITHHCFMSFLFDTNERARKKPSLFTTNKKTAPIRAFERFSGLLFDTFERPSIYPFLPPTRHGRIAAL